MLADLTHERFAARLNETFRITLESATLDLELITVDPLGERGAGRRAFSLVFRGPNEPVLAQGTYAFENDEMGTLELFAVPIGPAQSGMRYEVIFN